MSELKLKIFYGTETGNCKGLADKVAAKAAKNGVQADVIDLAGMTPDALENVDCPALFIISTWDDGAPPPKCVPFCSGLNAYNQSLEGLKFTVLALGDSEYPLYCECGKQVDAKLAELGGERVMDRTDLGADFMVSYIGWSKKFWKTMAVVYGVAA